MTYPISLPISVLSLQLLCIGRCHVLIWPITFTEQYRLGVNVCVSMQCTVWVSMIDSHLPPSDNMWLSTWLFRCSLSCGRCSADPGKSDPLLRGPHSHPPSLWGRWSAPWMSLQPGRPSQSKQWSTSIQELGQSMISIASIWIMWLEKQWKLIHIQHAVWPSNNVLFYPRDWWP